MNRINFGLTKNFDEQCAQYEHLHIARVTSQSQDLCRVITRRGELLCEISGKLRFEAKSPVDFPVVGDFVMIDRIDVDGGNAIIHHILPRKSSMERKAAGTSGEVQMIAANIDKVFICMSCNNDFNLRRLERYLAVAYAGGAIPVIVLTKADLCDDVFAVRNHVFQVCANAQVLIATSVSEEGYFEVRQNILPGETVVFVGSSGVGKSTLINGLLREDRLVTSQIRKDDKGRHTTTAREMFFLQNGGIVIDTPGMRELGAESADLGRTFYDVETLVDRCRFSDCSHRQEPGCAVRDAIERGILSNERLENYLKLQKESSYDGLNARQIESRKFERMFADLGGMKNVRKFIKQQERSKGKR